MSYRSNLSWVFFLFLINELVLEGDTFVQTFEFGQKATMKILGLINQTASLLRLKTEFRARFFALFNF